MSVARKLRSGACLVLGLLALAGCSGSVFDPPDVQGPAAMVSVKGEPRLWVLTKQEEERHVSVGSSRRSSTTRFDTYFHFDLKAFDPVTARPVWTQRLLSINDDEASGSGPSRVIGSSASGKLLGQEGEVVWLLIESMPIAVSTADGSVLANGDSLEERNPQLKGLMPSDAKFYGFDNGLVLMAADGRPFVIRGPEQKAEPYQPAPPPPPKPPMLKSNGSERFVPMLPPFGEPPSRDLMIGDQWIGLYSEKEAADAVDDPWGNHYLFPYSIMDESGVVRRSFWRGDIRKMKNFDEEYDHIAAMTPIADTPTFLKGRFLDAAGTGEPLRVGDASDLLVSHLTRIDSEGRVAITRLGQDLKTVWTSELPLSDGGTHSPVRNWQLPGHVALLGEQQYVDDGVTLTDTYLVSVTLADGRVAGWNLSQEKALEVP